MPTPLQIPRFQRAKYLSRIQEVRVEIAGFIQTYRTMLLDENHYSYTPQQLKMADDRQAWLEDVLDQLETVEESLSDEPEA